MCIHATLFMFLHLWWRASLCVAWPSIGCGLAQHQMWLGLALSTTKQWG